MEKKSGQIRKLFIGAHAHHFTSLPSRSCRTMFKRLQRKQTKVELEEELGIDDDTKHALGLGMHDTDSDESDSESDSDGELDAGLGADGAGSLNVEDVEGDGDGDEDEDEMEDFELEDQLDDRPPVTLDEALRNPIYSISLDSDIRSCLVCPRKLLKNNKMVELHLGSAVRRLQYFHAQAY